jgi:Leucine-rich repeat (LRR) protein
MTDKTASSKTWEERKKEILDPKNHHMHQREPYILVKWDPTHEISKKYHENHYRSFTEIPHYDEVIYLECSNNKCRFPNCPGEGCSYKTFTSLPTKLPEKLRVLRCSHNNLTHLPSHFPDTIEEIWCDNNKIAELPSHFPKSLKKLDFSSNQVNKLPETLPESMVLLWFSCNKVQYLPANMPKSLTHLSYEFNPITKT